MNSLLDENFTLPNTTTLLEQLHTIDNAACGWTNFMSKVCFDVDTIELTQIQIFKSHLHSSYDRKIYISDFFPARNKFWFYIPQVSVDIFRGFPDEESIVNYTLNQAYQDNVSVFASK